MKFRFGIEDSSLMLNHLLLNEPNTAEVVSKTSLWKSNEILEVEVKINGISVPPKAFDDLLKEIFKQAQVDSGKEAFEQAVEKRAKELLQEQADDIMTAMVQLHNKLEDVDSIVKFVWEE